jgi:hypothetical protein
MKKKGTDGTEIIPFMKKLPATPQPVPWRAFQRFQADADELLAYVEELNRIRCGENEDRTAGDLEDDSEWLDKLVAKVRDGFELFDHPDNYEEDDGDGERVLKHSHIAKSLTMLAVSFPAGAPGSPDGYLAMLIEHVSAVDGLTEVALESGCRAAVEDFKFLPAASELLKLLKTHVKQWNDRLWAMRTGQGVRRDAIEALRTAAAEAAKQQQEIKIQEACNHVQVAMRTTQRLAKEVEQAKAKLMALLEQHAQAERRESEAMRALRQVTMTPEEIEAEAKAKAIKSNGSGAYLL